MPVARELITRRLINWRTLWYALRQQLHYAAWGEKADKVGENVDRAMVAVEGLPMAEINQMVDLIIHQDLEPKIFPPMRQVIDRHLKEGHEVWLVSATPWVIAEGLADLLGVTGGIGTKLKVVDDTIVGELEGPITHGEEKAVRVRRLAAERGINLSQSWAYSDSINDLPMLECVRYRVAVNPEPRLKHVAVKQGWLMLDVRSRRDRAMRQMARGTMIAGAMGTTAVGVWLLARFKNRGGK